MARFNEILTGRFNRLAQKLLSMKGPASLVTLNDELQFMLATRVSSDLDYLQGWDSFGVGATVPAQGVGNLSGLRLRNPASSNAIAVITLYTPQAAVATEVHLEIGPLATDLGTPLVNIRLDARGRTRSALVTSIGTAVTIGGIGGGIIILTALNQATIFPLEIPLLPGDALQSLSFTANQAFTTSLLWRERFLEDSERT